MILQTCYSSLSVTTSTPYVNKSNQTTHEQQSFAFFLEKWNASYWVLFENIEQITRHVLLKTWTHIFVGKLRALLCAAFEPSANCIEESILAMGPSWKLAVRNYGNLSPSEIAEVLKKLRNVPYFLMLLIFQLCLMITNL